MTTPERAELRRTVRDYVELAQIFWPDRARGELRQDAFLVVRNTSLAELRHRAWWLADPYKEN